MITYRELHCDSRYRPSAAFTVIELLEWRPNYLWWTWWLLVVFMTNFIGYLVLRAYRVYERWNTARSS